LQSPPFPREGEKPGMGSELMAEDEAERSDLGSSLIEIRAKFYSPFTATSFCFPDS